MSDELITEEIETAVEDDPPNSWRVLFRREVVSAIASIAIYAIVVYGPDLVDEDSELRFKLRWYEHRVLAKLSRPRDNAKVTELAWRGIFEIEQYLKRAAQRKDTP